ncbi:lanthionine synthetase C family protein [Alkalihalophilus marmarensis]|uniref:lanthionine synthetase C family protein n=1 Tax=Alkalihalophilus marmarensis TaxID=521377 RepID=UPI00203F47FD|nr:lanthionine synthetase C family protein [Alkalihalophilus marmarensis]MCM3489938.1 lanthionine synthetase C family protein [Alkalihalophilus marmarensis]
MARLYFNEIIDTNKRDRIIYQVRELADNVFTSQLSQVNTSLAQGLPGVCLFYAELDSIFVDEGWDKRAHRLLKEINDNLSFESENLSLFTGITGVSLAVRALSKGGTRYEQFLHNINKIIEVVLNKKLKIALNNIEGSVKIEDYDVINGLAGIGRFLLLHPEIPNFKSLLKEILRYMVMLSRSGVQNNIKIPNWRINAENSKKYIDYNFDAFNNGMAHGISGPLSLLALAQMKGIEVNGSKEAIENISQWLLSWKQEDTFGPMFPEFITLEELSEGGINNNVSPYGGWCYGETGIARSLWLAGKALNNEAIKRVAITTFDSMVQRKENNIHSLYFCHGKAGYLYLIHIMCLETSREKYGYAHEVRLLVEELLESYTPEKGYGDSSIKGNGDGLLNGSIGVALVLLSLITPPNFNWPAIYLIN